MSVCTDTILLSLKAPETRPEEHEGGEDVKLPDEAFLMVAQEHWEDKILMDVPYTPSPPFTGVGGVWRSIHESSMPSSFSRQLSIGHNSAESANAVPSDPTAQKSLFPIDNYELAYYRWEDDIIWDSDSVQQIPAPSLPQIDPNDPNFIIGIPEEPPPVLPGDKDTRKVWIVILYVAHSVMMVVLTPGSQEDEPLCCESWKSSI